MKADSTVYDGVYAKIKELGNLDDVLFSGNILFKDDGGVMHVREPKGYLFTFPKFNLMLTDISEKKHILR